MLKRLLPFILLTTGSFFGATGLSAPLRLNMVAIAQTEVTETGDSEGLYYTFYDQRILLNQRDDQIAVQFAESSDTRGGVGASEPAYLKLQADLEEFLSNTRGIGSGGGVEVSPLGNQYALVTLPAGSTRSLGGQSDVVDQLDRPYVETTLPVVTRQGETDSIVVTPEMIVSFTPETTEAEAAALVGQYGLEIVRPLQFSPGRYLVSAPNAKGLAVLEAANQLDTVPGIQSATPNFVQSIPYETRPSELQRPADRPVQADILAPQSALETPTALAETARASSTQRFVFPNDLLPLQWYLNSLPMRPDAEERTDVYALEAWGKSDRGENVTVAVIDSLMQWDHPDLIGSVYRMPETVTNPLPGEISGWDFSNDVVTCEVADNASSNCAVGDPDTRISNQEIEIVKAPFQNTILLSDGDLLAAYPDADEYIKYNAPDWTEAERAAWLRWAYQSDIAAEFHGTWSAGVIAARPQTSAAMVGVAPNAQFLPVRVFGLGGSVSMASLVEASGYAAARDVDVINFSLGGPMPNEEFNNQLLDIMARDPNIVIVASAGNENVDRVSYPAAIPDLVSVGSTNISGNRSGYSSYGLGLDVVAPGGETYKQLTDGILTAGGTWVDGFWEGISDTDSLRAGGPALDPRGQYVGVQGTSFSAPVISGVVALMKDVDDDDRLSRNQLVEILQSSADYDELEITPADAASYREQSAKADSNATGTAEEYFFGRGLVNAEVAVNRVRNLLAGRANTTVDEERSRSANDPISIDIFSEVEAADVSSGDRLVNISPASSTVQPTVLIGEGELLDSDELKQDNGAPIDYFLFEGEAGDEVTITAESSDFDIIAGLFLVAEDDLELIAGNDNADESTTNSRIAVTLPSTGTYAIFLTTMSSDGRGAYRITLDGIEGS